MSKVPGDTQVGDPEFAHPHVRCAEMISQKGCHNESGLGTLWTRDWPWKGGRTHQQAVYIRRRHKRMTTRTPRAVLREKGSLVEMEGDMANRINPGGNGHVGKGMIDACPVGEGCRWEK